MTTTTILLLSGVTFAALGLTHYLAFVLGRASKHVELMGQIRKEGYEVGDVPGLEALCREDSKVGCKLVREHK